MKLSQGGWRRRSAWLGLAVLLAASPACCSDQPLAAAGGTLALGASGSQQAAPPDGSPGQALQPPGNALGIWHVPAAGGEATLLLAISRIVSDTALSPDRRRLAYAVVDFESCRGQLWLTSDVGQAGSMVAEFGPSELVCELRWSPDGQRLAYTVAEYAGKALRGLRTELLDTAGGGEPRRFVDGCEVSWSPDGELFVATLNPNGDAPGPDGAVVLLDDTGATVRRLGTGHSARWSRDGERVAFVTNDGRVAIARRDRPEAPRQSAPIGAERVVWSPASDRLVAAGKEGFDAARHRPQSAVVLLSAERPEDPPRRLSTVANSCVELRWLELTSLVVATADNSLGWLGENKVWTVPVDGGPAQPWVTEPAELMFFDGPHGAYAAWVALELLRYYADRQLAPPPAQEGD